MLEKKIVTQKKEVIKENIEIKLPKRRAFERILLLKSRCVFESPKYFHLKIVPN